MAKYITKQELLNTIGTESDNTPLCPHCRTILEKTVDDNGKFLYCPNEMCLNEERYEIIKKSSEERKNAMLSKPFPITSVAREDCLGFMSKKEVLKIDDAIMGRIASKLADAYCDNGFWIDLPIVVEACKD